MKMNFLTKNFKAFIAIGAVFFVILAAVLISNLIKLGVQSAREKELAEKISELDKIIARNEDEINYRKSDEYAELYGREYLDMRGKDEITFIGA